MKQKIQKINWEGLKKWKGKISILVDNPLPEYAGKGKESYVGYVVDVSKGVLYLHTPDNPRIQAIFIKTDLILSVWIYR